jgi:hypothetical protein
MAAAMDKDTIRSDQKAENPPGWRTFEGGGPSNDKTIVHPRYPEV